VIRSKDKGMREIKIGSRGIGGANPVYIVAEAGINHNGDLTLAKRMVDAAVDCGVDAVKFQLFRAEDIVQDPSVTYEYESQGIKTRESQYEMFKRYELSPEEMEEIAEYCRGKDIVFFATPQNITDLEVLLRLGVPLIKVGSDDLTHLSMLKTYASYGIPLILSTGMSYLYEIDEALRAILPINQHLIVLHCISSYPTEMRDANLLKIRTLMANYPDLVVGYSDHTQGTTAALVAVALGAKVYERHFTLSKDMPGPDHRFSIEPEELRMLVRQIRESETALGSPELRPTQEEEDMRLLCRRSIVAGKDLMQGEVLSAGNLAMRRPGYGLAPKQLEFVCGKKAKRLIRRGEAILLEDLC
jgi:N,N'-diacetyllegionaminate synthase